jgi:hypothetical protein
MIKVEVINYTPLFMLVALPLCVSNVVDAEEAHLTCEPICEV